MQYIVQPSGKPWTDGIFCVPKIIAQNYIKLASEYQIKALLLVLSGSGTADSKDVACSLGCTQSDAEEFLDFWRDEGILCLASEFVADTADNAKNLQPVKEEKKKPELRSIPVPTLTPKDIVDMCRNNEELTGTLRNAEEVLGRTLSHAEKEVIVNMITYYGLPGDVVLLILQYYKNEKENGKAISASYITAMAKNWSEEGITTFEAADEKLRELEFSDRMWNEIIALSGIRFRRPTKAQRNMISQWHDDFSIEMIALACDKMKENASKPSLKYVDAVLKKWKKKGITTPAAVEEDDRKFKKAAQNPDDDAIEKTYDIDELEKRAMFNNDFDI